jgi:hypothetical protein
VLLASGVQLDYLRSYLKYPALLGLVIIAIGAVRRDDALAPLMLTVGYTGIAFASAYLIFHLIYAQHLKSWRGPEEGDLLGTPEILL